MKPIIFQAIDHRLSCDRTLIDPSGFLEFNGSLAEYKKCEFHIVVSQEGFFRRQNQYLGTKQSQNSAEHAEFLDSLCSVEVTNKKWPFCPVGWIRIVRRLLGSVRWDEGKSSIFF